MSDEESDSIAWKSLANWDPEWETAPVGFSLVGARIQNVGPISDTFLPLTNKVTVLFGANGVGKSHLLRALLSTLNSIPLDEVDRNNSGLFRTRVPQVDVWIDCDDAPGFVLSKELDPWDPWRALWAGASENVAEQFDEMAGPLNFTTSLDSLVLNCYNELLAPFFAAVNSREDQEPQTTFTHNLELLTCSSTNSINPVFSMLTYFILDLGLDGLIDDTGNYNGQGNELITPVVLAALIRKRLCYQNNSKRSGLHLCLAPDGHKEYSELIRNLLYAKLWPNHDATTVKRIIAQNAAESDLGLPDRDNPSDILQTDQVRSEILALRSSAITNYLRDSSDLIDELDRPYLLYGTNWASLVEEVLGAYHTPHWATDKLVSSSKNSGPLPFTVIDESELSYTLHSLQTLVELLEDENRPELASLTIEAVTVHRESALRNKSRPQAATHSPVNYSLFIQDNENHQSQVDLRLAELAHRLTDLTNEILPVILPDLPQLTCQVASPLQWERSGPLQWTAVDRSGVRIPIADLSTAEHRWALFSIYLADAILQQVPHKEIVVIIDEPERALHRRAEETLAKGFSELVNRFGIRFIIASHSPAFLARTEFALHQVYRDDRGYAKVKSLPDNFHEWSEELGIGPTDLLQICRGVLLVEGEHELIILEQLLGQELRKLRFEMLCMRGARALKSWDAQLLQKFTDVPIYVLTDNDSTERISSIWDEAKLAHLQGRATLPIIQKLKSGSRGSEGDFLRELCLTLIQREESGRFHLGAFERADITEYLKPQSLSARAQNKTWAELRRESGKKSASSTEFKQWLRENYEISYDAETLKRAVQDLDEIPAEFVNLLNILNNLTNN